MIATDHDSVLFMVENRGFLVLSYLLSQLSPRHLSTALLAAIAALLDRVGDTQPRLRYRILRHLLFNVRLWIHAEASVQAALFKLLAARTARDPAYFSRHFGVAFVLDLLRSFYWFSEEEDSQVSELSARLCVRDCIVLNPPPLFGCVARFCITLASRISPLMRLTFFSGWHATDAPGDGGRVRAARPDRPGSSPLRPSHCGSQHDRPGDKRHRL